MLLESFLVVVVVVVAAAVVVVVVGVGMEGDAFVDDVAVRTIGGLVTHRMLSTFKLFQTHLVSPANARSQFDLLAFHRLHSSAVVTMAAVEVVLVFVAGEDDGVSIEVSIYFRH